MTEHHCQHLTFAFPMTVRQHPLNFNPASAWTVGVQMVALAHPGSTIGAPADYDGVVHVHVGRFAQENGGSGYVLKPPHLRNEEGAKEEEPWELRIRCIAGRAIPRSDGMPGLCDKPMGLAIAIWGASKDCNRRIYRPVHREGPTVVWSLATDKDSTSDDEDSSSVVFQVSSPQTATIVFEVTEVDANTGVTQRAAFFAAPVEGLRAGFRWIPLWRPGMQFVEPTRFAQLAGILVHVTKTVMRRRLNSQKTAVTYSDRETTEATSGSSALHEAESPTDSIFLNRRGWSVPSFAGSRQTAAFRFRD